MNAEIAINGNPHRHGGRGRGNRRPDGFQEVQSLLANALATFAPLDGPGLSVFDFNPGTFTPLSETFHSEDDFIVRLELPGVTVEDVSVELVDNRLVISGEKKQVETSENLVHKLSEVRYGSFKRVYPVPSRVAAENVSASFVDGILTVTVKDALKKSEGIKIDVKNK